MTKSLIGQVVRIPTAQVRPMPGQPRVHFDKVQLARLKDSIAEIGQQQPVTVVEWHDGTYRLRDGERRWRCSGELRIPVVALVVAAKSEEEEFELATAANMNREGHSPIEKAHAMKRLRDGPLKRSVAEIARTFGVTEPTVYSHLLILDSLPKDVLKLMDPNARGGRRRTLQLSVAVRLTVLAAYPAEQLRIAQRVVADELPMSAALQVIDRAADRHKIDAGRGRERAPPSDHLRVVTSSLHRVESVIAALVKDKPAAEDLFTYAPEKRSEVRQAVQRVAVLLERLARLTA